MIRRFRLYRDMILPKNSRSNNIFFFFFFKGPGPPRYLPSSPPRPSPVPRGGAPPPASGARVETPPLPPGVAEIDIPVVQVFDLPIEQPGPHAVLLLVDGRVASQLPVT